MKWTKRLKWIRISKIVIPIALAISLIFAGFTVYGHEAENFVVRIDQGSDIKLSLTSHDDLSEQVDRLIFPINGYYVDTTYIPDEGLLYDKDRYCLNLPNDIAQHEGLHTVYSNENTIQFFSASFWLVNNSNRAIDIDVTMVIESRTYGYNSSNIHMDQAIRVMFIETSRF